MRMGRTRTGLLVLAGLGCGLAAQCSEGPSSRDSRGERVAHSTEVPAVTGPSEAELQAGSRGPVVALPGGIRLVDEAHRTRDLGSSREGERLETAFEFVSDGEGPLVIDSIETGCGCAVTAIELHGEGRERTPYELGDAIPVGARFRLRTEVFTRGKRGSLATHVKILSNDPERVFQVRLTAEVEPMLDVTPERTIDFGKLGTTDQATRVVRVSTRRGEPFALTTNWIPEGVRLELAPLEPDEEGRSKTWEVEVTVGPGLPAGDFKVSTQLLTDLEVQSPKSPRPDGSPQYHLAVITVHKQGVVRAQPAFLGFGPVHPGQVVERTARIESEDGFQFAARMPVLLERTDGGELEFADQVSTTLEPSEDGRAVVLRVEVEGPALERDRSFLGVIKVRVQHPLQDLLTVRFSVRFLAEPASGGPG